MPAQRRGTATAVNSLNVLRRRTQGRRRETRMDKKDSLNTGYGPLAKSPVLVMRFIGRAYRSVGLFPRAAG